MLDNDEKQAFNEALLKLMLLIYRIDHKITLAEQDKFDEIKRRMDWQSTINIESYITHASGLVSQYVNEKRPLDLLKAIREDLNYDPKLAIGMAQAMMDIDQSRHEDEEEIMSYLTTKLTIAA
ncbi:hypothetical protein BFV94_4520 [Alteromonas macleodii]|uniref:Co-chaperone DjlA N-terminal domain-containing protein n=2 Tax=Alteromonas macleodii TaxID=28108 RepID=A0AB36FN86_ALTMA|nr:hypothetical protein BFV93_4737 [Alteromonas macleodii]OES24771.1 hypothetical protein BFV95_4530 [Alteromonas macleodii]OES25049.1 hypothetical protein BFV94_4520 [Alteromonas macleodii]OES39092.1 hypothetical protein BFV96_4240 [Alteromonas macleodii]